MTIKTQCLPVPQGINLNESVFQGEIDNRDTKTFMLENGLQVIIVSDPTASKAAAAMQVRVGSAHDPEDLEGLAHFLEHMLFMGTEKYPDEDEYNKYLSEHAGGSNAFTTNIATNYYFFCKPDALLGALDRFAQFFICPLFTESAVERETNAVNSEHTRNIPNDMWRYANLNKITGNPAHPDNRFHTGSIRTLRDAPKSQGINIVDALKDFHAKYYSANISTLSVIGNQSLEELESIVHELFNDVVNKNVIMEQPHNQFGSLSTSHPEDKDGYFRVCKPNFKYDVLRVGIPLAADFDVEGHTHADKLLSALMGDEVSGSAASVLKSKGLITNLFAYKNFDEYSNSMVVMVILSPTGSTDKGLKEVTRIISVYASLIARKGIPVHLAKECLQLQRINLHNSPPKEADKVAIKYAEHLSKFHPSLAIIGDDISILPGMDDILDVNVSDQVSRDFAERASQLIKKAFANGERFHITIDAQRFESDLELEDPDYGTKYALARDSNHAYHTLRKDLLCVHEEIFGEKDDEKIIKISEDYGLYLPSANEFMPEDFSLKKTKYEDKVHADDEICALKESLHTCGCRARTFIFEDAIFGSSKAEVKLNMFLNSFFRNEDGSTCVGSSLILRRIAAHLFVSSLSEKLTETVTYQAEKASLSGVISFDAGDLLVSMKVSGFNDKLGILFSKMAEFISTYEPTAAEVSNAYSLLLSSTLSVLSSSNPGAQAKGVLSSLTLGVQPVDELLNAEVLQSFQTEADAQKKDIGVFVLDFIKSYLPGGFKSFYKGGSQQQHMHPVHVDVLAGGNINEQETSHWITSVLDTFEIPSSSSVEMLSRVPTLLNKDALLPGCGRLHRVRVPNTNKADKNDVLFYLVDLSDRLREGESVSTEHERRGLKHFEIDPRLSACVHVLGSIIDQTFFDDLRTKQNLGYAVSASVSSERPLLNFFVETSKTSANLALARVEEFIEGLFDETRAYNRNKAHAFSANNFEVARESVLSSWLRVPTDLKSFLRQRDSTFNVRRFDTGFILPRKELINALKMLSYEEFKNFVVSNLGRTIQERRGLAVELVKSSEAQTELDAQTGSEEDLKNEHSLFHPERRLKDVMWLETVNEAFELLIDHVDQGENFSIIKFSEELISKAVPTDAEKKKYQLKFNNIAFGPVQNV